MDLRQRREDIATHKQLDGCTFRPQISERSLALSAQAGRVHGGSPRFEELWEMGTKLQNTRRSMSEYRREEDISDSELQECTFKPRINEAPSRRYVHIYSNMPSHQTSCTQCVRRQGA